MARTRYFDYQSPDSTVLLNNRLRGILQSGVYLGFNAVPGSSGLQVSLTMDSDPDNTGSLLGKIITPDAVVIEEDANLTDVATAAAADPTNPRKDALVASYTYNAGLPNNDVTYEIVTGTPAANPVLPALNDDQVLIAEINVAALQVTLTAADIIDVNRKNLYADQPINLENVLRNGVYTGFRAETGTNANDTTLTAGVLFTREETRIEQASNQVDLFTHTDTTSAAHYRYDFIVALHKFEDIESNPPDYIVVEGTEANESTGGVATVPTDSDIDTAALAFDPKYGATATASGYVTKLAIVRVQGITTSQVNEYHHTPRLLRDTAWYISSGKLDGLDQGVGPFVQFYPFTGHEGVLSAMNLLQTLVEDFYGSTNPLELSQSPIKVYVDGDFHFTPDRPVGIPSFVEVEGVGAATFRYPPIVVGQERPSVILGGFAADSGSITSTEESTQTPAPPANFERWEFSLDNATSRGNFANLTNGLEEANLAGGLNNGDPAVVYDTTNSRVFTGYFEKYTTSDIGDGPFTFTLILNNPSAFTIVASEIYVGKQHNALKNVEILFSGSSFVALDYALLLLHCQHSYVDQVVAPSVEVSLTNRDVHVGLLEVNKGGWRCNSPTMSELDVAGGSNVYDHLKLTGTGFGYQLGGTGVSAVKEPGARVGKIERKASGAALEVYFSNTDFGSIDIVEPSSAGSISMGCDCSHIGILTFHNPSNEAVPVVVDGDENFFGVVDIKGSNATFQWSATASNNKVAQLKIAGTLNDLSDGTNFEITQGGKGFINATLNHWWAHNESFDESTLNAIVEEMGGSFGSGGDEHIRLSGTDSGTVYTPSTGVVNFRTVLNENGNLNDLTEDGNPSTSAQTKQFYIEIDGTGTPDTFRWSNDGGATFQASGVSITGSSQALEDGISITFTATTGHTLNDVWYVATVDLSSVQPGDTFIDAGGDRHWVLAVDNAQDTLTLIKGLSFDDSIGTPPYCHIVRGNAVFRNTGSTAFTFLATDAVSGDVTFSSNVNLGGVKVGYLFRDGAGNLFPITSVTDGTDTISITNVFNGVDTSVATELDGSVEANNNPRQIDILDASPTFGMEVIPLQDYGHLLTDPNERLDRLSGDGKSSVMNADRRISISGAGTLQGEPDGPGISLNSVGAARSIIEITAWMTGAAIVVANLSDTDFSVAGGFIDGDQVTNLSNPLEVELDNGTHSVKHSGYSSVVTFQDQFRNLSPGIHTIRLEVNANSDPIYLVGVVVFNQPNADDDSFAEIPGTLFADNSQFDLDIDRSVSLPSLGARGGKLIRYAPASDPTSRAWAHTQLSTFSTTGTASNVSPTITVIPDTSGLQVGDLVRLTYASSAEKRRVVAVGAASIDVDTNPTVNGAVTIDYAGSTILALQSAGLDTVHGFNHPNEQIASFVPVLAPGTYGLNASQGVFGSSDAEFLAPIATSDREVPLSDGYTHIGSESTAVKGILSSEFGPGHQVSLDVDSAGTVRFSFVGTGLDVLYLRTQSTNIWSTTPPPFDFVIDGRPAVTVSTASVLAAAVGGDTSGPAYARVRIAQELDYGIHIVELRESTIGFGVAGFYIYEPVDPSFVGFPIWKSNYLGDHSGDTPDTVAVGSFPILDTDSGIIRTVPHQTIGFRGPGALSVDLEPDLDSTPDLSTYTMGRVVRSTGDDTNEVEVHYLFYGDVFLLEIAGDPGNSNAVDIQVEFLDYDGTFRAPSSFVADTVTGVSGVFTVDSAGTLRRERWSFIDQGIHVAKVRIGPTTAGEVVDVHAIGHAQRFHIMQRMDMRSSKAFLVPRPGGRDVRQLKGIETPNSVPMRGSVEAEFAQPPSYTTPDEEYVAPFRFYSRGEWVSLRVTGQLEWDGTQAATESLSIRIAPRKNGVTQVGSTMDDITTLSMDTVFYASEGYNLAWLVLGTNNVAQLAGARVNWSLSSMSGREDKTDIRRATPDMTPEYSPEDGVR